MTCTQTLSVSDTRAGLHSITLSLMYFKDREIEIIQALLDKVLIFGDAICQACEECAVLDCLLCFAEAARLYNYCRPTMTEENIIDIRQGR